MITLDDCPRHLPGVPTVVRLVPRPVDNARFAALLRECADRIDVEGDDMAAVAVVTAFKNGCYGSAYTGEHLPLLGAIDLLHDRILDSYR